MSTLENRIRTLVGMACADRNYLFGLPPMLDGLPKPGKTTGPWLAKYGESVTGTKARRGRIARCEAMCFMFFRSMASLGFRRYPRPSFQKSG